MRWTLPLGRVLYSAIFVLSGFSHFSAESVAYASAEGVPGATVLVPLSGVLAIFGGLMIAFGRRSRLGAWLIVAFLIPVTFWMHDFWNVADPQAAMAQQAHFMKNLALLGAALVFAYTGTGSAEVEERRRVRAARREQTLETVGH